MTWFPSIPGWDGIHPALVHFPIALLFVAPLLLIVSLGSRKAWRTWAGAALLVMGVGTFVAWLAVGSGHAAGQLVDKTPALERAIVRHEALGVMTRNFFTLLTVLFAGLMLLPSMIKKPLPVALRVSLHTVFLLLYVGCIGLLANTANQGGRLVHEFGVRAMIGHASQQTAAVPKSDATVSGAKQGSGSD
jgi:uncharacterized membrane protein